MDFKSLIDPQKFNLILHPKSKGSAPEWGLNNFEKLIRLLPKDKFKIKLCKICSIVGVAFIKTSTGYGYIKQPNGDYNYKGATEHDLILMRKYADPKIQIKAAGGVRTLDGLLRVKELGCSRLGASATVAIMEDAKQRLGMKTKENNVTGDFGY